MIVIRQVTYVLVAGRPQRKGPDYTLAASIIEARRRFSERDTTSPSVRDTSSLSTVGDSLEVGEGRPLHGPRRSGSGGASVASRSDRGRPSRCHRRLGVAHQERYEEVSEEVSEEPPVMSGEARLAVAALELVPIDLSSL